MVGGVLGPVMVCEMFDCGNWVVATGSWQQAKSTQAPPKVMPEHTQAPPKVMPEHTQAPPKVCPFSAKVVPLLLHSKA
jgi:hypothetical protein